MYSQEKVVYANTNVGQHVHFHDHTYSYKQSYESFSNFAEILWEMEFHSHNFSSVSELEFD